MKSLAESLFGDNITKGYTFGDLFELDTRNSDSPWKHMNLDKQFSAMRIKKATKVSGSDKNETIYKGLVQVIQDLKLKEDSDKIWLQTSIGQIVWDFFQYSLNPNDKKVYISFINSGRLILDRDKSLFDTDLDTIQINIGPQLRIVFKRK